MKKNKVVPVLIVLIIIVVCLSVGVYAGYQFSAKDAM